MSSIPRGPAWRFFYLAHFACTSCTVRRPQPWRTTRARQENSKSFGPRLWQLEDTRRETREALADLAPAALEWTPAQGGNSIGTLLYHIALIELDWLFTEVLNQQPWPQEVQRQFAFADRDAQGQLSPVQGVPLEEHLRRLDLVRQHLLASFRGMTLEEFHRSHAFPDYRVTAEWVLHYLIQHEAEHRGHIQMLRSLAEQTMDAR